MPTLYEELQADTRLTFLLAERNDVVITDTFNVGRTKLVSTKIGEIRVIATLGLEAGNALLDEIYGNTLYRYVKTSLQTGNLDIAHPLVRGTLDGLATAGTITQEQADLLKNLAVVPDHVTVAQISDALNLGI